jgi:Ca-activated chloride channel family protein
MMRKLTLYALITGLIWVGNTCAVVAQERTRILFVLDASLSMQSHWKGGTKWETACNALNEIADSLALIPHIEVGLRVLGDIFPEPDMNCKDSRLEVPIDSNNVARIKKKLEEVHPKGITPLVYAIERTPGDFGDVPARNILIVITDGEDACDRDACGVSAMLQKNNIILRPFIIGMTLDDQSVQSLSCAGKLVNTNSAEEFSAALKSAVTDAISKTTVQINLNDKDGKPTETDVNMSFYDAATGQVKYNLYHSLNSRGLPDTLNIAPMYKYKLQVHTIPPVFADVELVKNKHTIINVSAPQGYLHFTVQGNISKTVVEHIKCLLHRPGEWQTLNVQRVNTKEKYLTGTYDLEMTTLPRLMVKGIKVDQSKTTDVEIPAPGILTLNKDFEVYGAIFVVEDNKMKKIYDLRLKDRQETLALQPGKYRLVYRAKNARTIHTTVDKEFEITTGGSLSLKL